MKRIFCLILGLIVGLFAFAGCKGGTDSSSVYYPAKTTYEITYYAVLDGEKQDVPNEAWKENGSYPETYERGKKTDVDMLKASYNLTDTTKVLFQGWFTDEGCTVAFEGITSHTKGDQNLYAKLKTETEISVFSIAYYVIQGDEAKSLSEWSFLKAENGEYPDAYVHGAITSISRLLGEYKTEDKIYAVSRWYTDAACTTAFAGITVETCENISLYAKLDVQEKRTITYKICNPNDGVLEDVPEEMKIVGARYPEYYYEGRAVQIDNLSYEYYYPTSSFDWQFQGWYLDEACKVAFSGEIDESQRGDVTLYGLVDIGYWSPIV